MFLFSLCKWLVDIHFVIDDWESEIWTSCLDSVSIITWVYRGFAFNFFHSILNITIHLDLRKRKSTHVDGGLDFLDVLLHLSLSSVGCVKGDLKFVDVMFKLLLDAKSFSLTLGLGFKTGLDGVKFTLVVAAGERNS